MKPHARDPLRLDVEPFAKEGGSLEGQWPLADLPRLVESTHTDAKPRAVDLVSWSVRGELRPVRGDAPQIWLHLTARARLGLECQRCLQPVAAELEARRSFRFVAGETAAAELDADSEDDVLALTRALDVRELVEDELILTLPLVPRHDACPQPLDAPASEPEPVEERPNPFAALAALKSQGRH